MPRTGALRKGAEVSSRLKNEPERSGRKPGGSANRFKTVAAVGLLVLAVSCVPSDTASRLSSPATPTLWLMPVADLGVDIIVGSLDEAAQQLDFIEELGGYITDVNIEDWNGVRRMTAEFRVPHKHTERVGNILRNEFGEVTYISVLASDVSIRNARLRRELASLEQSLGDLSGSELAAAEGRIQLLRDSIAFQHERAAYLFVMVHFYESP
jgi:hypothetical protein